MTEPDAPNKKDHMWHLQTTSSTKLLEARASLLVAPGITSNKKLLVAICPLPMHLQAGFLYVRGVQQTNSATFSCVSCLREVEPELSSSGKGARVISNV